jgi:hypothetical protein
MKVVAAVLTFNALSTGRDVLLRRCARSLGDADEVLIVDNASTDGESDAWVRSLGGWVNPGTNHNCARGTNLCAAAAVNRDADLVVLSDDDMHWRTGWRRTLEAFWTVAWDDFWLAGCHLEPEYPWNQIEGVADVGGVPALVRSSTGAASWTFPAVRWAQIGPISDQMQGVGDVPACQSIINRGGRIAQLDLADHLGEVSTWGNKTGSMYGTDLAPVRDLLARGVNA